MVGIFRTTSLMVALALVATACDPGEDRIDPGNDDTVAVDRTPVTQANLQQVRSEVDSIMNELRTELEAMRGQVREDRVDRWTQLTSDLEETRGDVMEDLRQADTADPDEADRIREQASERVAEIEADVARNEIELTTDAQTLERRVDHHVQRLLSDIEFLQTQLRSYQARDDDDDWFDWGGLDEDDLADWQEELAEIRSDFQERTAEGDDLEDIASDLGDRIGDLTRDIREYVHALRWGAHDEVL